MGDRVQNAPQDSNRDAWLLHEEGTRSQISLQQHKPGLDLTRNDGGCATLRRCDVRRRSVAVFLDLETLPHSVSSRNVAVFLDLETLPHPRVEREGGSVSKSKNTATHRARACWDN